MNRLTNGLTPDFLLLLRLPGFRFLYPFCLTPCVHVRWLVMQFLFPAVPDIASCLLFLLPSAAMSKPKAASDHRSKLCRKLEMQVCCVKENRYDSKIVDSPHTVTVDHQSSSGALQCGLGGLYLLKQFVAVPTWWQLTLGTVRAVGASHVEGSTSQGNEPPNGWELHPTLLSAGDRLSSSGALKAVPFLSSA